MTKFMKKMMATVAISTGIFAAFGFNSFAADNTEVVDAPKYGVIESTADGCFIGCDSLYNDNDLYEDGGSIDDFEWKEEIVETPEKTVEKTTEEVTEDVTKDTVEEKKETVDMEDVVEDTTETIDTVDSEVVETVENTEKTMEETKEEIVEVPVESIIEEVMEETEETMMDSLVTTLEETSEDRPVAADDGFVLDSYEPTPIIYFGEVKEDNFFEDGGSIDDFEFDTPEVKGDTIIPEDKFFEDGGDFDDFEWEPDSTPEIKGDDLFPEDKPEVIPGTPEKEEPESDPVVPSEPTVKGDTMVITDTDIPKTGDTANIPLYLLLIGLSLGEILYLRRKEEA